MKSVNKTRAYFNPDNPSSVCLIRRPSIVPYLVILAPVVVASILVAVFWRSGRPEFKRRTAGWIAAVWLLLGVAAAGHYFWLAGSEYGGIALTLFALYMQLGLVPVMIAMPPATSSRAVNKLKGALGVSMFGTFVGFWLGLLIGGVVMAVFSASATTFLNCWGYTMATSAGLFALLSLVGEWRVGEQHKPSGGSTRAAPVPQPGSVAAPPKVPIPYRIDDRPMPSGENLEELLPLQVGTFRREGLDVPNDLRKSSIYAQYHSDDGEIFVEFGVCDDAEAAWKAVETSKAETGGRIPKRNASRLVKDRAKLFQDQHAARRSHVVDPRRLLLFRTCPRRRKGFGSFPDGIPILNDYNRLTHSLPPRLFIKA